MSKYYAKLISTLMIGTIFAVVSGCATIVGNSTQVMPINSQPGNASVIMTDETGNRVFSGKTPTSVILQKSDGGYFGGKEYTVIVSKSGYYAQAFSIRSTPNGWYLAGNLASGGLGWFIFAPLSGNMYTLSPQRAPVNLGGNSETSLSTDNGISVVLVQDVPLSLLDQMTPIN